MSQAIEIPVETAEPELGEWQCRVLDNLTAVEELMDWLEIRGYQELELNILGNAVFEVHWR
jgi:hypothetical protein